MRTLRLGTRGSKLALRQAGLAAEALKSAAPGIPLEIVTIATSGDTAPGIAFSQIPETSLFTKEIEQALLACSIDIAVHSCKDMASQLAPGLAIAATLRRENACDGLLSHKGFALADLPQGSRIGTSSLRRTAQLKHKRPDLNIVPLRGNVETRIRKMQDEGLDAIVLACAGIFRLNMTEHLTEILPAEIMIPAPGQGAIALEIREADTEMKMLLSGIHDGKTGFEIQAERAFLRRLQGGCRVPVGCHAAALGEAISITGIIASVDGRILYKDSISGSTRDAEQLGSQLARQLLADGGSSVLEDIKNECRLK